MAVNVDIVYKTVLLILNQQQRGYITPDEFNKVATQVQLTMFEAYAGDLNQQYRTLENDTEYGDILKNVEQQLEIFQTIGTAVFNTDHFTVPTISTVPSFTQTFVGNPPIDGVNTIFNVTTWSVADSQSAVIRVFLNGVLQTEGVDYTWSSNSNVLQMTVAPLLGDTLLVQLFHSNYYRLGTVIYSDNYNISHPAQYTQRNEITQLLLSPLTQPSEKFPLYLYEDEKLYLYPSTIQSGVTVSYLRKPNNVVWNYTTGAQGQYIYSPTSSQDFELDISEQTEIILRILAYSGVIIQDPSIIQIASQAVATEENNEKS